MEEKNKSRKWWKRKEGKRKVWSIEELDMMKKMGRKWKDEDKKEPKDGRRMEEKGGDMKKGH